MRFFAAVEANHSSSAHVLSQAHLKSELVGFLLAVIGLVTPSFAQQGVAIQGPIPWIDVTTYGAVADAKINTTAYFQASSSTILKLNDGTLTSFASTDVNKPISIAGAGLSQGTYTQTLTSAGSGGNLPCGATIYYQITYIQEGSSNALVSESLPTAPQTFTLHSCTGNIATLILPHPGTGDTIPTNAVGWIPYISYQSEREVQQVISAGQCALTTGQFGCTVSSGTWTFSGTNLVFDTNGPPTSPAVLTTIQTFTNSKQVTIADPASQPNLTGNFTTVSWGSNNSVALTSAINACIESNFRASAQGCTVYFPGPTANTTGRYFLSQPVTVGGGATCTPIINLTLTGGGSYGSGDNSGFNSSGPNATQAAVPNGSAEIAGSGRFTLVQFGTITSGSCADGINIINLGFRDMAGTGPGASNTSSLGNTYGAIRIVNVLRPHIERVNMANFGAGYGIELEGDIQSANNLTQIGTILDSNCSLCRYGIWAPQAVSDIVVQGGAYSGSQPQSSSVLSDGADFETPSLGAFPTTEQRTGSIRIVGTAFRNNTDAAVRLNDCLGCQVVAIKGEQVKASPVVGTGVLLTGSGTVNNDSSYRCTGDIVVGGGFVGYSTSVSVASGCTSSMILQGPLSSVSDAAVNPLELSQNGLLLNGATQPPSITIPGQFSYNVSSSQFVGGLAGPVTAVFPTSTTTNMNSNCAQWTGAATLGNTCPTLDQIVNPAAAKTFAIGNANFLTWGDSTSTATSTGNLVTMTDAASNSGTGSVLAVKTGTSSSASPFTATAQGTTNGVQVSTSGVLAKIGSGHVNADQINGSAPAASATVDTTNPANINAGALANGMTATAQSVGDTSTKLATDAFIGNSVIVGPASQYTNGTIGGTTILTLPGSGNIVAGASISFDCKGLYSMTGTAEKAEFGINASAAPQTNGIFYYLTIANTQTGISTQNTTTNNTLLAAANVVGSTSASFFFEIAGGIIWNASTPGTIALIGATANSAGTLTINANNVVCSVWP